jgi:SPW repeat
VADVNAGEASLVPIAKETDMFKALQWEDWVGIALGAWMLVSPWIVGFSGHDAATINALVMGSILVLEELLELQVHEKVEEWIDLVAGVWLIVSPFALGFASLTAATVNTMAVGVLTVLFAAWAMSPLDEKIGHWWHEHGTGH